MDMQENQLFKTYSSYSSAIRAEKTARRRQRLKAEQKSLLNADAKTVNRLIEKHRSEVDKLMGQQLQQHSSVEVGYQSPPDAVLIESRLLDELILLAMEKDIQDKK